MTSLDFTRSEIDSGQISQQNLAQAVEALTVNGYVVLNEIVHPEHAAVLRERMIADTQAILARDDVPFNFNRGNIQQDPPPFPPYLFRDVLANDLVIAVTRSLLGPGLKNAFYSGNTSLPGVGARQPVHADTGQLWPDLAHPHPPYALVINVFPVDVSPRNGSTEIWPGTHTDPTVVYSTGEIKVPPERVEERRAVCPPFQPTARAGSVVIRDIRLWHAGMPNHSTEPRPMIAMIHYVSWWSQLSPVPFARGSEPFFAHPDLTTLATLVDGEIDYLHHNQAYDFKK